MKRFFAASSDCLTRRKFVLGVSVAVSAMCSRKALGAETVTRLVAKPGLMQLTPKQYPATEIWGYGGTVPGTSIRVRQGARVRRDFFNLLPQASSIHWHGIRIENSMDGVAGVTQEPVGAGQRFRYDFAVPDAGTYFYHPHNRTFEQMARGLYGPLIVEEKEGAPDVDRDEVLMLDDWRLTQDAQIAGRFGAMHDLSHAGRIGNWITVNGQGEWTARAGHFSRLRLRLINTANARIFTLKTQGMEGWIVALDGMPLDVPERLDQLILAPSQRADLIVDIVGDEGGEARLVSMERDGGFVVGSIAIRGAERPKRLDAPKALPPNPVPALGPLTSAQTVGLLMEGGARGRMRRATLAGKELDIRQLVLQGKAWAFNGVAGMSETPLLQAARGETVRIRMRNDTAWPHAMHLHGHHFRVIGEGEETGPLRDTVLMESRQTTEIAFVADNPGDWLIHCHMLEHSAAGMMTWLKVS